jgi:hypothetical protein
MSKAAEDTGANNTKISVYCIIHKNVQKTEMIVKDCILYRFCYICDNTATKKVLVEKKIRHV